MQINALTLSHKFIADHIKPGGFCIDATAGRGRDTLFLCGLVRPAGRVLAFDIQQEALDSAKELLDGHGLAAELILDSHDNMSIYASPETVDCVVFNFGWLPSGSHKIFTRPETSVRAISQGLDLLKPGGIMSLCLYYGRDNGYEERDAVLTCLKALDPSRYTVIVGQFINRKGDVPIPVFIIKQG